MAHVYRIFILNSSFKSYIKLNKI